MTVLRGRARVFWVSLSVAAICAAPASQAVNIPWAGADNSGWTTPGNWPTSFFPSPAADFEEVALISNLNTDPNPMPTAVVTTVHTTSATAPAGIILGLAANQFGEIVINSGGTLATVAAAAPSLEQGQALIGQSGTGSVIVNSGGSFQPRRLIVGEGGTGVGTVVVNGSVTVADTLQIGQAGRGTFTVNGGGTVTAGRVNTAGTTGATATLLSLDGSGASAATFTSQGPTSLLRNTQVIGTNVNFTSQGTLTLQSSHLLIADIRHATNHSVLKTSAGQTAFVSGAIRPQFTGVTPALGNFWTVVEAPTISGGFTSVDTSAAPALPTGQSYQTRKVAGGPGQRLQVGVEQLLTLEVNRQTGAMRIKNTGAAVAAADVAFDIYNVGSTNGGLNGANWNSLTDQTVAGWSELPPAATLLSELNSAATTTISGGQNRTLGSPYTPIYTAFRAESDDVSFTYGNANGTRTGLVEYIGTKVQNNLVITVNPTTGATTLKNDSPFNISIEGYSILSASGALRPANGQWSSLDDQGVANFEEAAPTVNALSELATTGSLAIAANETRNMGTLFNPAGMQDLTLEFLLQGDPNAVAGVVLYQSAPTGFSADFNNSGSVRGNDLTVWRNNFPLTVGATKLTGDSNLDGDTDGADFLDWQRQLGSGPGPAVGAGAAVPEPSTWMLSALAGALLCRRPRRKTNEPETTMTSTRSVGMKKIHRHRGLRPIIAGLLAMSAMVGTAAPARAADLLLMGGTLATDIELITALKGFGHTILNEASYSSGPGAFTAAPPSVANLSGVDAIVFTRSANSGDYDDALTPGEPAQWNAITTPLIHLNSAHMRGGSATLTENRWGWFNTSTAARLDTSTGAGDITNGTANLVTDYTRSPTNFEPYPNAAHPFVNGRTTSAFAAGMTHDWTNSTTVPAGTTVVATMTVTRFANGVASPFTIPGIVDYPPGTTLFADAQGVSSNLGGRRVFFQETEYPDTTDVVPLTTNGFQIVDQIIDVVTSNAPSKRAGDVDGDGDVDNADLDTIKANWGKSGVVDVPNRAAGDLNGDYMVGLPDFRIWKENDLIPPGSGVPEPAAGWLALLGSAAFFRRGRKRKRTPLAAASGDEHTAPPGAFPTRGAVRCGLALAAVALSTLAAAPVHAINIGWVSFHPGDNMPSQGAIDEGYTQASDVGYTTVLAAAGHTVTRFVTVNNVHDTSAASVALRDGLNAANIDVVIISRAVDSGHYQDAVEATVWNNTINKPMMIMGGYVLRQSRLGFTSNETIPDTTAPVKLTANVPGHAIFSGVALDGSNVMVNDFSTPVITINTAQNPNTAQRGISMNELPIDAAGTGGTLIASLPAGTPGGSPNGNLFIAEWAAGTTITKDTGAQPLSKHRLVFLSGSREQAANGSSQQAGMYDLTATGEQMFKNAVGYLGGFALKPGDVDLDGDVDLTDFGFVRDNFQKTVAGRAQGDLTGDLKVNFLDYRQWKGAYVPPAVANGGAVPEPAGAVLGLLALAGVDWLRRRGRGA